MKELFFTLVFLFYYIYTTEACKETFSYNYSITHSTNYFGTDGSSSWGKRWRCTFFTPIQYHRSVNSATITCFNVSSTLNLNYTYQTRFYDQNLAVVDSEISVLPSNSSLASFSTIKKLTLKNLKIEDISAGAFDGLEVLHTLDLSSNKLTRTPEDVFDDMSTLVILDLSKNSINNVDRGSLYGLFSLKELYLNRNNLTVLYDNTFKDLTFLETLDISDNPLEELQDVGFTNLKRLIARNTHLRRFDIDLSSTSMFRIDLSGGHLEDIDFALLPTIEELNLSDNFLKAVSNWDKLNSRLVFLKNNKLEFVVLPHNVTFLDMSYNRIISIHNKFLNGTSQLQSLNISHNSLTTLNPELLPKENKLMQLYLDHNNISWFEVIDLLHRFKLLKDVTLDQNPWSCENLKDIVHWLNVRGVKVLDSKSLDSENINGIPCKFAKRS